MNDKFVDKYNDRVVRVTGIAFFEDIDTTEPTLYGTDRLRTKNICIKCTDEVSHIEYVIPLYTFLNVYVPYATSVDDMLLSIGKQLGCEDAPTGEKKEESE